MRFSLSSLNPSPWKNGGGVTREIAVFPHGATLSDFAWRISVATISASGPFSSFPGIDRIIMLLEGEGVELTGELIDHRLERIGMPFSFSGDQALSCSLVGGASSDFNVMSRRTLLKASCEVVESDLRATRGCGGLVMSLAGHWMADGEYLDASEGLYWTASGEPLTLRNMTGQGARLVLVRFEQRD